MAKTKTEQAIEGLGQIGIVVEIHRDHDTGRTYVDGAGVVRPILHPKYYMINGVGNPRYREVIDLYERVLYVQNAMRKFNIDNYGISIVQTPVYDWAIRLSYSNTQWDIGFVYPAGMTHWERELRVMLECETIDDQIEILQTKIEGMGYRIRPKEKSATTLGMLRRIEELVSRYHMLQ